MPWLVSQPPTSLQIPWLQSAKLTCRYLQEIKFSAGLWKQASGKSQTPERKKNPYGKKTPLAKSTLTSAQGSTGLKDYRPAL